MKTLFALAVAAGLTMFAFQPAEAQTRTKIGVLECVVQGGTGFIVGSNKALSCSFDPTDGVVGAREFYQGSIRKVGLDVGTTERTIIKWVVLAPSAAYVPRALAGRYVGASGEATLGVGLGANALVGGSGSTIALQPLSVQAQTGLNLSLGVASLTLR